MNYIIPTPIEIQDGQCVFDLHGHLIGCIWPLSSSQVRYKFTSDLYPNRGKTDIVDSIQVAFNRFETNINEANSEKG